MSRFSYILNRFQRGQANPKFLGNIDAREYQESSELLENCTIGSVGGAFKRPASKHIVSVERPYELAPPEDEIEYKEDPFLIPFITEESTFFLVLFKKSAMYPEDIKVIEASTGSIDSVSFTSCDYQDYLPAFSYIDSFLGGTWQYVQYGNTMFITHSSGNQPPMVVYYTQNGFVADFYLYYRLVKSSGVFDKGITLRMPYKDPNILPVTMTPSGTTGDITITPLYNGGVTQGSSYGIVKGSLLKITHGATTGVVIVTGHTSGLSFNAKVIIELGGTAATDFWELGAWDGYRRPSYTSGAPTYIANYPRSVTIHDARIYWGGSVDEPNAIWGSVAGNVLNMMQRKLAQDASSDTSGLYYSGEITNLDAFSFRPGTTELSSIKWMGTSRSLVVGTSSSEFLVDGGNEILGALNINIKPQTFWGSEAVQPVLYGTEILFVTRGGKKIRNFRYSDENGAYVSFDMTSLSDLGIDSNIELLTRDTATDTVWGLDRSGNLFSITYSDGYSQFAAVKHRLSNGSSDVDRVLSVYCVRGTVYVLAQRGEDFFSFSSIDLTYEPVSGEEYEYLDFLESATAYDAGDSTASVDLPDSEVSTTEIYVQKDNEIYGPFPVTSGTATGLPSSLIGDVSIGCGYKMKLRSLPLEAGGEFGPGTGDVVRIDTVTARLFKTHGGIIKGNESSYPEKISVGTDLFTGDNSALKLSQGPTRKPQVYIESEIGKPLNILALIFKGVNNIAS